MTIIDHPSPNHSARRKGVRVDTIVLHHTGTTGLEGTRDWLCSPRSQVSAHYLVGRDGTTLRLAPEERKAWHTGLAHLPWEKGPWKRRDGTLTDEGYDLNHRSIGIELVNPGDGVTPFTEAQYAALEWLVPDIVRRLGADAVYVRPYIPSIGGKSYTADDIRSTRRAVVVLGHRDIAPGRKTDPADNFDWARVCKALSGGAR